MVSNFRQNVRLAGPLYRGPWKVDWEGFMASIVHNMLKVVSRLGHGAGPPELGDLNGPSHPGKS